VSQPEKQSTESHLHSELPLPIAPTLTVKLSLFINLIKAEEILSFFQDYAQTNKII
jgi:hypothetical protein